MFLRAVLPVALTFVFLSGAFAQSRGDIQQLKNRKVGQTEFYGSAAQRGAVIAMAASAGLESAPNAKDGGPQREIQESDIFKVGEKGSKLLYLLNNYRGLQTVRFSEQEGKIAADLVGRVEATGNYPADMYYIPSAKRLIVLERVYFDRQNGTYSENQSRIVVYDVSNAEQPEIVDQIPFKGTLSDSRMVGDVLYVGSKVTPNWYNQNQQETAKGLVTSFSVATEKVAQIEQLEFSAPLTYHENMNIIEVPQSSGGYKYYLAAVTQAWRNSWWDNAKNFVELVDITDAKGHISSVMRVPVKGQVEKRSQLVLKDGALIVVSNYNVPSTTGEQWRRTMRVAVETFLLPGEKSTVIDTAEAEYRRHWRDREIRKLGPLDEAELNRQIAAIDTNADNGLRGVFVKSDKGTLEKPQPDFYDSRGDTTGLSANLRDVRIDGDLMYVSWVPSNNIDPVDLYQIKDVSNVGPTYLNRTQFDGWIERSIPLTYKGKKFLLALGYIVPSDSEQRTRKFQAILFEMVNKRGKIQPEIVSQIALTETNGWSNFHQDKLVEVKFTGDGIGQVLFSQSAIVGGKWTSGGKLVQFDLGKADTDADGVFREGAFLEGSSGYLRRIFNNSEIARINSFSDLSLATYEGDVGDKSGIVKAAGFLELARNIRAYVVTGKGKQTRGIQIVTSGHVWSSEESRTELRFVSINEADAELRKVLHRLELEGTYSSHVLVSDKEMIVTTQHSEYKDGESKQTNRVYRVDVSAKTPKILGAPLTWNVQPQMRMGFMPGPIWGYGRSIEILKISEKEILILSEGEVRQIQYSAKGETVHSYTLPQSPEHSPRESSLMLLDGKLFLFTIIEHATEDHADRNNAYSQNFLTPISLKNGKVEMGKPINVPGRPLGLKDGKLVTTDTWEIDSFEYTVDNRRGDSWSQWAEIQRSGLLSLQIQGDTATLQDILEQNSEQRWTPLADGSFLSIYAPQRYYNSWHSRDYATTHEVQFLNVGDDFKFSKEVRGVHLSTSTAQTINAVYQSGKNPGQLVAVLTSWSGVRLLQWDPADKRPETLALSDDAAETGCEAYLSPGMGWWYADYTIGYSAKGDVLTLPLGLAGVKTVYVK